MTEEEKKKLEEEGKSEVEIMQLEKIAEMKAKMEKMVDPEKFNELEKQYKKLLDEYVNQRPEPKPEAEKIKPIKEVASKLTGIKNLNDVSNREYIKTALEYRKSYIAETGKDPFTDFGEHGPQPPNEETEKVAETLETLLKENETTTSFRIALNEALRDDPRLVAKLRKRRVN